MNTLIIIVFILVGIYFAFIGITMIGAIIYQEKKDK